MTTGPMKVAIALNEFEGQKKDNVHFISSYHGNQRQARIKPTRSFRNWMRYFKIPYFCFIDIAVFCFYIILAVFHENSSITFSVDLENAIHSFLLNDLSTPNQEFYLNPKNQNNLTIINLRNNRFSNTRKHKKSNQKATKFTSDHSKTMPSQIIDPPLGIPFGEGQIFLLNDFIYMLDETTNKLFQFSSKFPMSYPILDYGYVTMTIKLLNGTVIEHIIKSDDENDKKTKINEEKTNSNRAIFSSQEEFTKNPKEENFEFTEKSFLNDKVKFRTKVKGSKPKLDENNKFNQNGNLHNNQDNFFKETDKFIQNENLLNNQGNFFKETDKFIQNENLLNNQGNFFKETDKFIQNEDLLNNQGNFLNEKSKILENDDSETKLTSDSSSSSNTSPSFYVIPYLTSFEKVSVSMAYHLQIIGKIYDSRINLEIISDFERDKQTDTIIFDIYHTRFQEKTTSLVKIGTTFYTFNYSLPIVISLFNFLAIFRLIKVSICDLYTYSKRKSEEVGQTVHYIFKKKFDKWNLYALFTHFFSIISMILYILIGQNIEQKVPTITVFLSIAAFNHSILLIRYLNLKDTTFLVITVLFESSVILVKFLIGCLPFFFAFWVFGICFFGHLSFIFASPLECASYLFCVMHGDSILAFFDNTIIQNDYNWVLGFIYSASWLMFSLLLVFNITISIFQDVLRQENSKLAKKKAAETEQNYNLNSPLHLDFLTNNIRLMMNTNQYKNPNALQDDIPI